MAATAEVIDTNGAAEGAAAAPTPPAKPRALPTKPEAKAEPEKPKAKPAEAPVAPEVRESNIAKFAKAMNSDAEKDGVEVDAPPEERRAKPGPKPGSKRAPAPKPEAAEVPPPATKPEPAAQANPTELADEDEPAEVDEDADTGKPEPRSTHQLKAKARLRHGDVDKAIRLAFGDLKPEEFEASKEALARKLGVGSKQWADFRRYQQAETTKAKQLESNAMQLSQRLQADFGPMIAARKAFAAGDYPTAFQHAFGEDINAFQRKALHQHLSQDPEKVRMRQELDELKRSLGEMRQPAASDQQQAASPEQAQAAALNKMARQAHEALTSQTDDPEIAHYAQKKSFCDRVVELRGEHYDPQTRTTIPLSVAADMARDELHEHLNQWRYDPTASGAAAPSSELPGQAGNQPVRTSAARTRSPLPSHAAQAGGSTRSMTRDERIRAFASRMG